MKRLFALILACVLALSMVSCGQKGGEPPTWQEQYDLGLRYLEEGNYGEAILAFTAAIEIDPKRAEAHVGLADGYVGLDDADQARRVLEEAIHLLGELPSLTDKLESLMPRDAMADGGDADKEAAGDKGTDTAAGDLQLSDFRYSYEDGGKIAEWNEGAIGGMNLDFTVNGPTGVADVLIWSWSAGGFTEREISASISGAVGIWKEEFMALTPRNLPFSQTGYGFPVWEDDRGTTVDVLLIGLDENIDAVAYAIVTVDIP